ncbi:GspH/FimT family pseudopilin [Microbulbifer celer]|uniref:Type II secretion system protein H n=1 Tax=Microbulbifer celer TaxID=435905 RepID=A0ABW3UET5_9GAMM|nr:GspH/FimT family pseudopilin [Microbulbifer celer]UFN56235.1 GspH/FimT family pseudopilin [Microbulbifer celer]
MDKTTRQNGFTLVELMVVIAVLGIILAIGVPSFRAMIQDYRIVTTTDEISSVLQFARAEAVRLGGGVGVKAVGDDVANGLRVFEDANANGSYDAGEEVRVFNIENANLTLASDVGGIDTADLEFIFNARGEPDITDTLNLGMCDERTGNYGRQLQMLVSGAVRLQKNTACSS